MTAYDSLWQLMSTYDNLWQLLTTFDIWCFENWAAPKTSSQGLLSKNGKKWHFRAITDKSEENGLCLKFDFTLSRVSQKFCGGILLPYLETWIFKNQIFPISWGFATTFQHHTDKEVLISMTVCLSLFLKLDYGSGQVWGEGLKRAKEQAVLMLFRI